MCWENLYSPSSFFILLSSVAVLINYCFFPPLHFFPLHLYFPFFHILGCISSGLACLGSLVCNLFCYTHFLYARPGDICIPSMLPVLCLCPVWPRSGGLLCFDIVWQHCCHLWAILTLSLQRRGQISWMQKSCWVLAERSSMGEDAALWGDDALTCGCTSLCARTKWEAKEPPV